MNPPTSPRTYYLHTANGKPGRFASGRIMDPGAGRVTLVPTLAQIKAEQDKARAWYAARPQGQQTPPVYGYVLVAVPNV